MENQYAPEFLSSDALCKKYEKKTLFLNAPNAYTMDITSQQTRLTQHSPWFQDSQPASCDESLSFFELAAAPVPKKTLPQGLQPQTEIFPDQESLL